MASVDLIMAQLVVRQIEDVLKVRLPRQAKRNGRAWKQRFGNFCVTRLPGTDGAGDRSVGQRMKKRVFQDLYG